MDSDEITAIMENRFTIDCTQLTLTPQSDDTSKKIHEGSGFIGQSQDGSFSLKIYCNGDISPMDVFSRLNLPLGEIINEQHYYRLSAKDIKGRQWEAKSILPDIHAGPHPAGYIVNARIRELSYSSGDLYDEVDGYYAGIYFPGDITIPCNTITKVEKIVDGEQRSYSGNLNISKFNACGIDFEIEKEADWLMLRALSNTKSIDDAAVVRFAESLQFVLAKSLSWSIVELFHRRTKKVKVRSCKRNVDQSRIQPPIQFQSVDPSNNVWSLFSKYLGHVINYNNNVLWHPIFRWIHAVIESGCSSIDTESLILSVAVEGLLNEEFNKLEFRSTELEAQIEKVRCIILQSDLEQTFKDRLLGSFGGMLKPRAKDLLHILKDRDLINALLLKEYGKLRDSSAHGEVADSSKFQVHLDRCAAVLVLFYHLIFLAIGYTGPYTDYSTHGFPVKEFKSLLA